MRKALCVLALLAGAVSAQFTTLPPSPSGGSVGGASNLTTVGAIPVVSPAGALTSYPTLLFWDGTKLAIGTNAPDQLLTIKSIDTSTNSLISFKQGATTYAYVGLGGDNKMRLNSLSPVPLGVVSAGSYLWFETQTLERARFAVTTGNLLIGTTTDANFKLDVANSGSAGTVRFKDLTATTGTTKVVIGAGEGQSGNLFEVQNNAGTALAYVSSVGKIYSANIIESAGNTFSGGYFATGDGTLGAGTGFGGVTVKSTFGYLFSSTSAASGALDLGINRNGPGTLEINSGATIASAVANARDLTLRAIIANGTTPAVSSGTIGTGARNAAGFITSTTTGAYTGILTFTGTTAPIGWGCSISNNTTANLIRQTAYSTTTATFSGTTVTGDVLTYSCIAF